IRKNAIKHKIPYITTPAAAVAVAEGIKSYLENKGDVKSLQAYHSEIGEESPVIASVAKQSQKHVI
ncbi:MAG: hypothetical protein KKD11_02160, partial [Candidatus Omnitrophica bacterium]|nr:hypothetical protein [Candidatus Omnitrophota bacterium]